MIQRIQTIFLILYISSLISSFFFPVWQKISFEEESNRVEIMVTGYITSVLFNEGEKAIIYENFIIGGIIIISCIIALLSIFSFKNRLTQIKLGAINSFINSMLIIYFLYQVFYNELYIQVNDKINFLISFYLIFLALFFNFLANRFIRKDELLVRESDRIR